jgi:hypothetical protein
VIESRIKPWRVIIAMKRRIVPEFQDYCRRTVCRLPFRIQFPGRAKGTPTLQHPVTCNITGLMGTIGLGDNAWMGETV